MTASLLCERRGSYITGVTIENSRGVQIISIDHNPGYKTAIRQSTAPHPGVIVSQ